MRRETLFTGTRLASVVRAPLSGAGAVGAWTDAVPLPSPRAYLAAAAWAGRIYVLGGLGEMAQVADVEVLPVAP